MNDICKSDKRANKPLDPAACYSTRPFFKCKLEVVGQRKAETFLIINIYILLLNREIYTIQSHKVISVRDAWLHSSQYRAGNECIHHVLLHPKWGKSLKVVLKWLHLQRWCMVVSLHACVCVGSHTSQDVQCVCVGCACKMRATCLPRQTNKYYVMQHHSTEKLDVNGSNDNKWS